MRRHPSNPNVPTVHDELVKAVVGAMAPAHLRLERFREKSEGSQDVSRDKQRIARAKPVDLLHAFGMAPALGQLAWRARWNRERTDRVMVAGGRFLTDALMERRGYRKRNGARARAPEIFKAIGRAAFFEWSEQDCPVCGGSQVRGDGKAERWVWRECGRCRGTGRIPATGIPWDLRTRHPRIWHNLSRPCAVQEAVGKRLRAEGCGGVGRVRTLDSAQQQRLTCGNCHGTGRASWGDFQRARYLGVDLELYRKRWASIYELALEIMDKTSQHTADLIDKAVGKRHYRPSEESDTAAVQKDQSDGETPSGDESPPAVASGQTVPTISTGSPQ